MVLPVDLLATPAMPEPTVVPLMVPRPEELVGDVVWLAVFTTEEFCETGIGF